MPLRPPEQTIGETPRPWRVIRNALAWLFRSSAGRSHLFIVGSGVLVCAYALGVICCVLSVPDIGVRCTFTPEVDHFFPEFLYPEEQEPLQTDDVIDKLGGHPVENWPQFLRGLAALRDRPEPTTVTSAAQLKDPQRQLELARLDGEEIVRVEFTRNGRKGVVWCRLGH